MKSCNDWVWANDPAPGRGAIVRRVFAGPITESGRALGRPVRKNLSGRSGMPAVAPSGIAGPIADQLRNPLGFTGLGRSK